MKRYVIVGNGTAGASAVGEIRARDKEGAITVFARESHPYYYRPKLPDYMAGQTSLEKFTIHGLSHYEKLNVDLRLGENVAAINPAKREVRAEKSGTLPYDELLLATGSSCFLPPAEGNDKAGVFTLRTIADADAIVAEAKKTASREPTAVLVGAGLLGLEAGHALIGLGLKVEVVELSDRLLPRQLDGASSKLLQTKLEAMGFSFRLGAKLLEITGGEAVAGVVLEDTEAAICRIDCGLVLFSAGVRPNLELAKSAGLELGGSVKVDKHMRTSSPGIWAAGDVAEFEGRPCGVWPTAMAQGKIAGASMAGVPCEYIPRTPGMALKVAGIELVSAGNIDAENSAASKLFVSGGAYRKIVLEEDVIKGVIFLGSTAGANDCIAAMDRGHRLGKLADGLDREGFDFGDLRKLGMGEGK